MIIESYLLRFLRQAMHFMICNFHLQQKVQKMITNIFHFQARHSRTVPMWQFLKKYKALSKNMERKFHRMMYKEIKQFWKLKFDIPLADMLAKGKIAFILDMKDSFLETKMISAKQLFKIRRDAKTNFHRINVPLHWIHVDKDTWMILERWYIWRWCHKHLVDHIRLCLHILHLAALCSLLDTDI